MAPCPSTLGRAQGLAQSLPAPSRHLLKVRPARRPMAPSAAAAGSADLGVDLKSLLKDSLEAPARKKLAVEAPPSPAVDTPAPAGPVPDLPGTEILPSAVPPPAATLEKVVLPNAPQAAAVQGFDIDVFEAPTQAVKAAAKATATAAPKELSTAVDSLGSSSAAAVSQASEAATQAAGAVTGAVSDAAAALTQGVGGAASAIGGTVTQAADVLTQGVGGAASAIGGTVGQAAGAAGSAVSAATAAVSGVAGQVTSVFEEEISVIKSNLATATGAVESGVSAAEQVVNGAVAEALGVLPSPVKDALSAAGSAAVQAVGAATATPETAAVATGLAVGLPAVLLWKAAFSGFAGTLDPQEALDVLQGQEAVLVDVRAEAQRLQNGIAELRRGALGKGAAVPPVQLPPSLSRRVRGSDALALEIQGALIAGLAKVGPSTKVIVMDNQGERAKAVARAAARAGVRAYVLRGGFRAWAAAGLRVREGATDYDASVVEAVEDQVEAVAEVASAQVSKLKDPKTAATVTAGALALGYAVVNFHTVLQFIGVVGLELTLYLKYLEYDSPEEALEDLQRLLAKVSGAVVGAGALLPAAAASPAPAARGAAAAKPAAQPTAGGGSFSRTAVLNSDDE